MHENPFINQNLLDNFLPTHEWTSTKSPRKGYNGLLFIITNYEPRLYEPLRLTYEEPLFSILSIVYV